MTNTRPILSVVLGVVSNSKNQVLMALRPPHVHLGGYWEFPGGKIEQGETAFAALQREMTEEVGIIINAARLILEFDYAQAERTFTFSAWQVTEYVGEPSGCEGQTIQWVDIEQLPTLKMPPSNEEMWPKIKRCLVDGQ